MISRWWWGPKVAGQLRPKDHPVRSFDGAAIRYRCWGSAGAPVVALCGWCLCPDTHSEEPPALPTAYPVGRYVARAVGSNATAEDTAGTSSTCR